LMILVRPATPVPAFATALFVKFAILFSPCFLFVNGESPLRRHVAIIYYQSW
jgi:hypothetical protein